MNRSGILCFIFFTGGLDSTNNNRLEGVNSNKDAANYNAVFSPIRDSK